MSQPKYEYYMEWREDFDDQWGWFTLDGLKKEIDRIKSLEDYEPGEECCICSIIKGEDVTKDFGL